MNNHNQPDDMPAVPEDIQEIFDSVGKALDSCETAEVISALSFLFSRVTLDWVKQTGGDPTNTVTIFSSMAPPLTIQVKGMQASSDGHILH